MATKNDGGFAARKANLSSVKTSDVKMQTGARDGGYRGVDGKIYAWKIEAERTVAAGFKNDQRSFGKALAKGVNIYAKG